jgi:CubicO group peptidase (beta-lactamase class C family)
MKSKAALIGASLLVVAALIHGHAVFRYSQPIFVSRGITSDDERVRPDLVDAFVTQNLQATLLPGLSIAIVKDDAILYTAGYGTTSRGQPVGPDTLMLAASLTKSVTALATLKLVEAGEVGLDTTIDVALPTLSFVDARSRRITISQLLNQSSGLDCPRVSAVATDDLGVAVRAVGVELLAHEPGERWQYCNTNYFLLTRVIEEVTAQPFGNYLAKQIFAPLGMTNTSVLMRMRSGPAALEQGHSMVYGFAVAREPPHELGGGAGGLVTTANDLAQLLAAYGKRKARTEGSTLLSPRSIGLMWTSLAPNSNYAFGWRRDIANGNDRVFHSGRMVTYSAHQTIFLNSGYGYAIMWNALHPLGAEQRSFIEGLDALLQADEPKLGKPIGLIADSVLAGSTVLLVCLALMTVFDSRRWALARRHSMIRSVLSLSTYAAFALCVLLMPTIAAQALQQRLPWTKLFEIWPALGVLIVVSGMASAALVAARAYHVARVRHAALQT